MGVEELERKMKEEEKERMHKIGMEYTVELLNALQDSARLSGQSEEEEHVTIGAYLEDMEG